MSARYRGEKGGCCLTWLVKQGTHNGSDIRAVETGFSNTSQSWIGSSPLELSSQTFYVSNIYCMLYTPECVTLQDRKQTHPPTHILFRSCSGVHRDDGTIHIHDSHKDNLSRFVFSTFWSISPSHSSPTPQKNDPKCNDWLHCTPFPPQEAD